MRPGLLPVLERLVVQEPLQQAQRPVLEPQEQRVVQLLVPVLLEQQ